jgi:hypothetical protein
VIVESNDQALYVPNHLSSNHIPYTSCCLRRWIELDTSKNMAHGEPIITTWHA